MRTVRHRYVDPLDAVWLAAARGFGLRVERSPEVYASTDGRGLLLLGTDETLDADDCLAQMIFHELCHAAVQSPEGLSLPDWGLDNESARDVVREHACLRLQAELARRHGLRTFFAPTTDFRSFYDALADDPLEGEGPESELARESLARILRPPFAPWVERGLSATAAIVGVVRGVELLAPPEDPTPLAKLHAPD